MRILDHLNDPAVSSIAATPTKLSIARPDGPDRTVKLYAGSDFVTTIAEARAELLAAVEKSRRVKKLSEASPMLHTEMLVTDLGLRTDVTPLASNALLVSATDSSLASGETFVVARRKSRLEELVSTGTLSADSAAFLRTVTRAGASIVIAGMTGSGRTTLYYALLEGLALDSRAVSVERIVEARLGRPNVVQLEDSTIAPTGDLGVALRTLALADSGRLALDEVREGAEVEALAAAARRRSPFLATIHSRAAEDVRARFESLGSAEGYGAVDLVVQLGFGAPDLGQEVRYTARIFEATDSGLRVLWSDGREKQAADPTRTLRRRLALD